MLKNILEMTKTIVVSVVLAFIITLFIIPLKVDGISMFPTLHHEDFLILEKTHKVEKGDIISFKSNMKFTKEELKSFTFFQKMKLGDKRNLIKRVIGTQGDKLVIKDGKVYINDKKQEENYINGKDTNGDITIEEIPKNKVFVMGDNRNGSVDSRVIGLVDTKAIQGKILIRIIPFSNFGIVN